MTYLEFWNAARVIEPKEYLSVSVEMTQPNVSLGPRIVEMEYKIYVSGRGWFESSTPEGALDLLRGHSDRSAEDEASKLGELPVASDAETKADA